MNVLRFAFAAMALMRGLAPAAAQSWPTKPVKIIAVLPAGGSVDIKPVD